MYIYLYWNYKRMTTKFVVLYVRFINPFLFDFNINFKIFSNQNILLYFTSAQCSFISMKQFIYLCIKYSYVIKDTLYTPGSRNRWTSLLCDVYDVFP
jgi:hypothetical protein